MPLFEYECPACRKRFEKLQGTPAATLPCPDCGAAAQRMVSAFATGASGDSGSGCAPPGGSGFR
jgi:putative FmdB family regulatory protein